VTGIDFHAEPDNSGGAFTGERRMRIAWMGLAVVLASSPSLAFIQTRFATESDARQHCPGDAIVWQILPGNLFVRKPDKRYGATQRGSYMCERDAVADGARQGH
jgi:hypothetical protein